MTEVRSFELLEFVLLACHFTISGEEDDAGTEDGDTATEKKDRSEGIEVEGALLNILDIDEDDDEFVFILQTTLTDTDAPYRLSVVTGSRITVPEPAVSAIDAAATLLFISYPYVREVIHSVTGRSPFGGFVLPPLTKRPVWGEPAPAE